MSTNQMNQSNDNDEMNNHQNTTGMSSRDIGMRRLSKKKALKSVIVKPIHQRSAIVSSRRRSMKDHHGFGLKKMIGYLSGALLQYFGQVAVLRGPLWMCTRKVPLTDFNINDSDYKKVYVVLTKNELLGYRSLLHAESDTKSPLFQHNLKSFVSVLRIEEMLSAMTISSPNAQDLAKAKSGVFIVSMVNDRVVFRAEGNLSREVWMDNLEALLTEWDDVDMTLCVMWWPYCICMIYGLYAILLKMWAYYSKIEISQYLATASRSFGWFCEFIVCCCGEWSLSEIVNPDQDIQ